MCVHKDVKKFPSCDIAIVLVIDMYEVITKELVMLMSSLNIKTIAEIKEVGRIVALPPATHAAISQQIIVQMSNGHVNIVLLFSYFLNADMNSFQKCEVLPCCFHGFSKYILTAWGVGLFT